MSMLHVCAKKSVIHVDLIVSFRFSDFYHTGCPGANILNTIKRASFCNTDFQESIEGYNVMEGHLVKFSNFGFIMVT